MEEAAEAGIASYYLPLLTAGLGIFLVGGMLTNQGSLYIGPGGG